ncbi:hypothetical protein CU669_16330 [Paramagnetospirillum kuznetsovii]|uniref:Uncharacterized protein n=1 Tax=Paramagnetospirillum kuznetsovii TaxID=2053833 RepID=A0A364NV16_9PROT|nr:hypothetical protein [Paramagnetospirillum kuznetsovii]RAU20840.1 hypothetical protein CU669_16330 [Paramagnetospirillum kuznetsovii]
MAENDILARMRAFPAPECRCGARVAETGRHDPHCLFAILREGAMELERLRGENKRLSAMTIIGGPGQGKGGDRNVWVRLMFYFGTNGVWNSDDEKADVAALALSPALKSEIVAWKTSLDNVESVSVGDVEVFSTRAMNVARRVKEEAPGWRVIYVDRTKSGADIRNKDYFEHEVVL